MKFKKIVAILLILVMCFSLAACDKSSDSGSKSEGSKKEQIKIPDEVGELTPLLYKVTDAEGHVAWLFGSIHVGEEWYYPLPNYVLNALDNADSLAVEFDILAFEKDINAQMEMITGFIINDGRTIKDFLPDKVYNDAKKILEDNGIYNAALDYYIPAMWSDFIEEILYEEIGVKLDLGIDKHLINRAYKNKQEVLNVESAEFQFNMMTNYSPELQSLLLEGTIEGYNKPDEVKDELNKLLALWAKGDAEGLEKLLSEEEEFESETEKALYEEYNNAMIVERNKNMTDWAENALKSGKEVFICVGAAHVVGEGAMAEMLRDRGYTVELVK